MLIPVCAPSNLIVSICIYPHIGYHDSGRRNIRHVEDISVHSPLPTYTHYGYR